MKRILSAIAMIGLAAIIGPKAEARDGQLTPASHDYTTVTVGDSATQDFTFTRLATGLNINITVLSVVLTNNVDYTIVNDGCSQETLTADGQTCIVTVGFNPQTVTDDIAGALRVLSTATNSGGTFESTLVGDGVAGPVLNVKPASLLIEFPATGVGQTSLPEIVEIQNTGTTPLENVALTLPIAPYFSYLQDHCTGSTLASGESCLVQVVFTPDDTGLTIDELITISADNVADQTLTIRGEGIDGPALAVLPTSGTLSFADTGVGQTSAPQIVEIHSVGTVTVENLAVSTPSSVFPIIQDNCSGNDLAPGQSCLVLFAFAPDETFTFDGIATLSTDTFGSGDLIDLEGTGIGGPLLSLSSSALSFGDILVGNVDFPQLVQVRNSGTADVSITSVTNTGPDFFLGGDTCTGVTVEAGESCFLQVVFGPTEAGNLSDTFTVASDADNQPTEFTVEGVGVPIPVIPGQGLLQIKTDVMSFDIESGGSASQSTTVTNLGDGLVEINALTLEGDSQFSQTNDCEGQTLAPGASCTITATFSSSSTGNFNAVVTIDSDPDTSAFLVLLGASLNDEIGGDGGCSLNVGANAMGASWLWLAPVFAVGFFRRRIR